MIARAAFPWRCFIFAVLLLCLFDNGRYCTTARHKMKTWDSWLEIKFSSDFSHCRPKTVPCKKAVYAYHTAVGHRKRHLYFRIEFMLWSDLQLWTADRAFAGSRPRLAAGFFRLLTSSSLSDSSSMSAQRVCAAEKWHLRLQSPLTLRRFTEVQKAWHSRLHTVLSICWSYENDNILTESSFHCGSDGVKSSATAREME